MVAMIVLWLLCMAIGFYMGYRKEYPVPVKKVVPWSQMEEELFFKQLAAWILFFIALFFSYCPWMLTAALRLHI